MNLPIIIRPRAQIDLETARDWYNERRTGLGYELVLEVRTALHKVRQNPERYAIYYRDFRRALLKRFPYKIFYRYEGQRIIVFRVLHARQDHTRHVE